MPVNPRKRLEKLEQQLAEIKRRESPAKCNCRNSTPAASAEYFQAEMNQTCPVHGFRRLGKIHVFEVQIVRKDGNVTERSQGVPELVQEFSLITAHERWKMTLKNSNSPCQALTKKGKPCRAAATEGGLCFFHANPNKAVELGRIGGKKNGLLRVGLDPLPNLDNAMAVRDTVARLLSDVYSGKLHPRIAARGAPLMHLQLRVLEKTEVEKRLAKVERLLRDLMAGN